MRGTLGGFWGLLVEQVSEYLEQGPEVSEVVLMMEVSRQRVSSWIHAAMVARKMLPIPVN